MIRLHGLFGGFMLGTEECQSGSGSKAESGAGNCGYGSSSYRLTT